MKKIIYKDWQINPHIAVTKEFKAGGSHIWKRITTKHEGDVLYHKQWNFWVRAGVSADLRSNEFFRNYETANAQTDALLQSVGFTWHKAETEEEIWDRIGMVWNWMQTHVEYNPAEAGNISSIDGEWPSIADYAAYFATHGKIASGTCFSKAHIFANLLGRMVYPRFRFAIASAHHTENGAPSTATHVFVAAYVSDRWFYLDSTANYKPFPAYADRKSIGEESFDTVDYEHPYMIIPIPLSGFAHVPYLGT